MSHPVVLYDGVCGMCNRLIRMILRRDSEGHFRFATQQGPFASAVLERHHAVRERFETMYVLLEPGTPEERLLSHSDAAVYVLSHIRGPLRMFRAWGWLPHFLRDWIYRFIARNRYRWFGRFESCPLPPAEWKQRFLD